MVKHVNKVQIKQVSMVKLLDQAYEQGTVTELTQHMNKIVTELTQHMIKLVTELT